MSRSISRRQVLRGMGTALALPMLEGALPLSALAQSLRPAQRPNRIAFLFVPNGVNMEHWTPATEGALDTLPTVLEPLQPLKSEFQVLTGLAQRNAFALGDGPGDHARSSAAWLTGVHPKKTAGSDIQNGISADQVASQHIGGRTRLPSLELGCERGAVSGNCDSGYSCAYSSSISWRSPTTPMPKEVNPRMVFERLFGDSELADESLQKRRKQRISILDLVAEDAAELKRKLGSRDKLKIEEYFTSVRDIESRLERMEESEAKLVKMGQKPTGVPSDYGEHVRLMGDMMILAFQADLTRISTFMFANEGSNRNYRNIGISDGHHDISHHGKQVEKLEKKRRIDRFHVEQLAYILNRMRSIREVEGTLLDNTMLLYGGGIGDGDRHNHDDLPILLAGRGAGKLMPGRHVRFRQGTPLNNLFLSMLDKVGVDVEQLGDSTGKLQGLL
ncbi:MAG: DUF1552 domain-containing protein [Fimbriimonadaceae bacterium]|uniref:DUF1552 domain-containing protein n=1 Tax=Candidatus Nitrosymbiomonas proteolyticus TaxID=2608984 RepID=A0A809RS11_9BACT|nr:DUF1552 domain-containing protein [Fimbriimonadaceae bacterium]NUM38959.1 DUF1552 domain-containing protein [Armatimonadota bacterium]BBO22482.1 conserved hypothetical protein [Candidatus Nitrosymbiomonas proteolyticus]